MGTSSKHILDKIDRIRAKGDQRRADRIADARFTATNLYQPATNPRVYTTEEVEQTKERFREQRNKSVRNHRIIWVLTIILTPICIYLLIRFLFADLTQ